MSALHRGRNNITSDASNQTSLQSTNNAKTAKQCQASKKSFAQNKHRSRSVEVRFKSIGAFLTPKKVEQEKTSNDAPGGETTTDSAAQWPAKTKEKSSSHSIHAKALKSTPLLRKTYTGEPAKTSQEAVLNASINFKALERKNELERQKLSQIMKKLEIDLMNAKIDLNEDGDNYLRSTPINVAYPCLNSNFDSKPQKLPLQQQQQQSEANINGKCLFSSVSSTTSSSSSSGVVATTGPSASSASSSMSTSPHLRAQQSNDEPNKMSSLSSMSSSSELSLANGERNFILRRFLMYLTQK